MTLDKETLLQLKEGTLIEFRYNPLILGIGSEDITATFIRANLENKTITVKRLYHNPVIAEGGENEIDYRQVSILRIGPQAPTGAM
jgi:hypothetical protein